MNTYIFLTGDEYTFQPETEAEPVTIENLQMLGTAKGSDAMTAYRNLLEDQILDEVIDVEELEKYLGIVQKTAAAQPAKRASKTA